MFGPFKHVSVSGDSKPSLDSIRFDTTGFSIQGETQHGKVRVWCTPDGDGLGVYFFQIPPNLPANAQSVDELISFYRRLIGDTDAKLVEVGVVEASGCSAVRTILSVPQPPSGCTYVGSLTLPFRDFSFVIKCQCGEVGPTAFKESLILDRHLKSDKSTQIEGEQLHSPNWNPDAQSFDREFPSHPVARARRVLAHIAESLVIANKIKELPGFHLPR